MKYGRWETIRQLGAGHFGQVHLASRQVADDSTGTARGALKLLKEGAGSDALKTIKNEINQIAGINHPNLSRLVDNGETPDGTIWFVMDYVEGFNLFELVRHYGVLKGQAWIDFVRSMLGALVYLSDKNMMHLDIKPDNIIYSPAQTFTIVDFGLASRVYGDVTDLAHFQWSAPERLDKSLGSESSKSDVCSMAMVIYFVATQKHPWLKSEGEMLLDYFRAERLPDLSGLEQKYQLWLQPALAMNPAHRPSAKELLADFDNILTGFRAPVSDSSKPKTWDELRSKIEDLVDVSANLQIEFVTNQKGSWRFTADRNLNERSVLTLSSSSEPRRPLAPAERQKLGELGWIKVSGGSQELYLEFDSEDDSLFIPEAIQNALYDALGLSMENIREIHY